MGLCNSESLQCPLGSFLFPIDSFPICVHWPSPCGRKHDLSPTPKCNFAIGRKSVPVLSKKKEEEGEEEGGGDNLNRVSLGENFILCKLEIKESN